MAASPKTNGRNSSSFLLRLLMISVGAAICCLALSLPVLAAPPNQSPAQLPLPTRPAHPTQPAAAVRGGAQPPSVSPSVSAAAAAALQPTPAATPGVTAAGATPLHQPAPLAQQAGDHADWPPPPLNPQQPDLLPAAVTASYADDFSLYPVGETPSDWSWYTWGEGLMSPIVVHYGGGDTDDYKRLEIHDQPLGSAENWLIKNDVYYGPAQQVEAVVNFQTDGPGLAGIVLGWKDLDNFTAVLLDQADDTVWILTYSNGSVSSENNGIGSTVIEPGVDYRLIAHMPDPLERGMSYINVWLEPFQSSMTYLFTSEQPIDVRGRMGVGVVNGLPRVVFDNFWVDGSLLSTPTVEWMQPGGNGAQVDVYGTWIDLSAATTDDINIWRLIFWRWDDVNFQWVELARFSEPPYSFSFNTGQLNFGGNYLDIDILTVDNRYIEDAASLTLNRLREPGQFSVPIEGPTLTADGQSMGQITATVWDYGGNLLPEVPVSFIGENVSVDPATVLTDDNGQATVAVTAGTAAGSGKVIVVVKPGALEYEVPLTLLPGAPFSFQIDADQTQLVADGAGTANIVVTVFDEYGNRVPDVPLSFAASLGMISDSAVTNSQGQATVQFVAGTDLGNAEIVVEYGIFAPSITIALVAGPPAQLTVSANPASLPADGESTGEVRAAVTDAYGHPVAGRTVQFSTSQGTISADAVTDAQGEAAATLTAGSSVGGAEVLAWLDDLSAVTTVQLVPGPPAILDMDAPLSGIVVEGDTPVTIAVTVRDAQARPLPGVTVYFTSTLGSITPSAVTNGSGTAAAVLRPNGAVGVAHIRVSAAEVEFTTDVTLKSSGSFLYMAFVQSGPAQTDEPPPLLVNGYFDQGMKFGWTQLVNDHEDKLIVYQPDNPENIPAPVSAPYVAWLGGRASQVNQLSQPVLLPGSYAVSLEYMYYTESAEKECNDDVAAVEAVIAGASRLLQNIPLCAGSQTKAWRKATVDLAAWRGQSLVLQFRSSLDADKLSNLFLDNVRFCSSDPAAPAAMPACGG